MMPLQAFEVMVKTKRWCLQFFFIPGESCKTSRFIDGEGSHIYGESENFSSAFVKPKNSNTNPPLKNVVEKMNRTTVKLPMLEHASFESIFRTEVVFHYFFLYLEQVICLLPIDADTISGLPGHCRVLDTQPLYI